MGSTTALFSGDPITVSNGNTISTEIEIHFYLDEDDEVRVILPAPRCSEVTYSARPQTLKQLGLDVPEGP